MALQPLFISGWKQMSAYHLRRNDTGGKGGTQEDGKEGFFRKVLFLCYAVNDMDNMISEIDYNDPMAFFDIEKLMGKVISKELKCNSLE